MSEEYERLSLIRREQLSECSDSAKEYLKSHMSDRTFDNYIETRLATDFTCRVARIIAEYRKDIIQMQSKINDFECEKA